MDDCWAWEGYLNPNGYGQTKVGPKGQRRSVYVHRLAYEQFVGPIPPGLQIDHLCRNRACYNPSHLEAVTPAVNTYRSLDARGAWAVHGSRGRYVRGCRCAECRRACAEYEASRRAARRQAS